MESYAVLLFQELGLTGAKRKCTGIWEPAGVGRRKGGDRYHLNRSNRACGKVWKLLFRFIWVLSWRATLPNICGHTRAVSGEWAYTLHILLGLISKEFKQPCPVGTADPIHTYGLTLDHSACLFSHMLSYFGLSLLNYPSVKGNIHQRCP